MADKNDKTSGNAAGKFYVDSNCTGCGLCESEAPHNFAFNDDSVAYVMKQPENEKEMEACESAMEDCPVNAIGNDGA